MKLVQKLPVGLGFACLLAMSSCSKDDVQAPQPETNGVRTEESMRGIGGGVMVQPPYLAKTNGSWGLDQYAVDWQRKPTEGLASFQQFPSGTSGLKYLWGNDQLLWVKALPEIPGVTSLLGMLTVTTKSTGLPNSLAGKSIVKTKLKNLKAGKRYEATFYVSTSMPIADPNGNPTSYAKEGVITMTTLSGISGSWTVPLAGKPAEWVKRTITFIAHDSEAHLEFHGTTYNPGEYAFVNLYVDKNSIEQVYY